MHRGSTTTWICNESHIKIRRTGFHNVLLPYASSFFSLSVPTPSSRLPISPACTSEIFNVWEWSVSIFFSNRAPDLNAERLSVQRKGPLSRIHKGHISLNVFVTEEQTSALSSFLEAGCVRARSSGVGFGSLVGGRMLRRWTDCQRTLETPSSAIKQPLRIVDSKRLQWESSVKHTFLHFF